MNDTLSALREGAAELGLTLTPAQEDLLGRYLALMLERNQVMNLTAITDPVEAARKHLVDALTVELARPLQPGERLIDIGAGAGLPGFVIAVRHPEVTVVLNDATRKKADFMRETAQALGLANVEVAWARAEDLGRSEEHRGQYDVVTARAVAHLSTLIELGLPLLRTLGDLVAMKGPTGQAEVAEAEPALDAIGGLVTGVHHFDLTGVGERDVIVVRKTRGTPKEYPREANVMKRRPLRKG